MLAAIDPLAIASEAADKDFRWWFLALLSILVIGAVMVVRYLVNRDEKKSERIHGICDNNTAAFLKLEGTIALNNHLHTEVKSVLERVERKL